MLAPPFRRLGVCLALAIAAIPALAQEIAPPLFSDPNGPRAIITADAARAWEAVGRLDTGVSFCTATLIAPDLVLTAAHCLFTEDGARLPDGDLRFAASLRHGRAEAYREVARSLVHPAYEGPDRRGDRLHALGHDIALLELTRAIPDRTVAPLGPGHPGRVRDAVTVVSYGRDREAFASIERDCAILAAEDAVQILSCTVVEGSSGAPVLRVDARGVAVIGVMSARAEWQGDRVSVAVSTGAVFDDLMAARGAGVAPGQRRAFGAQGGREGIGARFVRP